MATTGDGLVITGSIVNLRSEPSLNGKILLRLAKGKELVEISRYQEWVEVATKREDVDSGWIHSTLLAPVDIQADELDPDITTFNEFQQDFDVLIDKLKSELGINPFSGLERVDHGSIAITANSDWFSMQQIEREKLLSEIFHLWRGRVEIGYSVMIEVIDSNNERHMMMFQ